jgi:hypothetical protein
VNDLFSGRFELTNSNIDKYAPDSPGVIIIYNNKGNVESAVIAKAGIKTSLLKLIESTSEIYFSFRNVNIEPYDID